MSALATRQKSGNRLHTVCWIKRVSTQLWRVQYKQQKWRWRWRRQVRRQNGVRKKEKYTKRTGMAIETASRTKNANWNEKENEILFIWGASLTDSAPKSVTLYYFPWNWLDVHNSRRSICCFCFLPFLFLIHFISFFVYVVNFIFVKIHVLFVLMDKSTSSKAWRLLHKEWFHPFCGFFLWNYFTTSISHVKQLTH